MHWLRKLKLDTVNSLVFISFSSFFLKNLFFIFLFRFYWSVFNFNLYYQAHLFSIELFNKNNIKLRIDAHVILVSALLFFLSVTATFAHFFSHCFFRNAIENRQKENIVPTTDFDRTANMIPKAAELPRTPLGEVCENAFFFSFFSILF